MSKMCLATAQLVVRKRMGDEEVRKEEGNKEQKRIRQVMQSVKRSNE